MTTVIGLDLSLTGTGISDGTTTWLVKSAGKADARLDQRHRRLTGLAAQVLTRCYDADMVVIEQPAYSKTTGHMHDRSGLWWLVVSQLHDRGVAVVEVAPSALKAYATGRGNSNKGAMIEATVRRMPQVEIGGDDNRVDALWLSLMGLDHLTGTGVVPQGQRDGLSRVAWPVAA